MSRSGSGQGAPPVALLRERRRRIVEVAAGLAVIVASVLTVGLVYAAFRGSFGDDVSVSAGISDAGDSLVSGDAVIFRDVIVGEVRGGARAAPEGARVTLRIKADYARVIPDNVTAIAVPINLFGKTAVELVPPPRASARMLHAGQHVAADTSPGASGLQSALADAYTLLTAVRPADLDAALTALATALRGQGDQVGELLEKADAYLRGLAPSLPALAATIADLATVTEHLARDAPQLTGALADLLDTARTVTRRADAIRTLLGIAPSAVGQADALVTATADDFVTVVNAQQAVLAAFRDNPQALPKTLTGFRAFADSFGSAMSTGPYVRVNVLATGVNSAALGALIANQPSRVLAGVTDPTLYTAADCPRYGNQAGPDCPATATAKALVARSTSVSGEAASVRAIADAVGVSPAAAASTLDVLLGPLVRGTATVIL